MTITKIAKGELYFRMQFKTIFNVKFEYLCSIILQATMELVNIKSKTKRLRAIALLWFLVFVFITPNIIQLAHQFEHNDHGHNEMHQAESLHYQVTGEHCGIFSFEFSSFQKDILIKNFQIISIELFQQDVFIEKDILACSTILLPLLRGPPF